jgi:hypothetical protein
LPGSNEIACAGLRHATGLKPAHAISLLPGNGGIDGANGDHIILAPPSLSQNLLNNPNSSLDYQIDLLTGSIVRRRQNNMAPRN